MGNINKDILWSLFRSYLIRKEKESNVPCTSYGGRCGGIGTAQDYTGYNGMIYFYEWSDVTRTPRSFYTLKKFEEFLSESEIFMLGYQREIIKNMHNPYITCRKGTKELIIKVSYEALKSAVNLESSSMTSRPPFSNFMAMGSEDKGRIQRPMVYEPEGRWQDENEFQWYG